MVSRNDIVALAAGSESRLFSYEPMAGHAACPILSLALRKSFGLNFAV
jgi:hypothetical protein